MMGHKEPKWALNPFPSIEPKFDYWSEAHCLAAERLDFSIGGLSSLTVFTGPVGSGKTTVIRKLVQEIQTRRLIGIIPQVASLQDAPRAAILRTFGANPERDGRDVDPRVFQESLDAERAKHGLPTLVVEDAHAIDSAGLEQLFALAGLETDSPQFKLVLVGHDEMRVRLATDFPAIIGPAIELEPMSQEDTAGYVNHRLAVAKFATMPFTDKALKRIHDFTNGIPLSINVVCMFALDEARERGEKLIDAEFIDECCAHPDVAPYVAKGAPDTALKAALAETERAERVAEPTPTAEPRDLPQPKPPESPLQATAPIPRPVDRPADPETLSEPAKEPVRTTQFSSVRGAGRPSRPATKPSEADANQGEPPTGHPAVKPEIVAATKAHSGSANTDQAPVESAAVNPGSDGQKDAQISDKMTEKPVQSMAGSSQAPVQSVASDTARPTPKPDVKPDRLGPIQLKSPIAPVANGHKLAEATLTDASAPQGDDMSRKPPSGVRNPGTAGQASGAKPYAFVPPKKEPEQSKRSGTDLSAAHQEDVPPAAVQVGRKNRLGRGASMLAIIGALAAGTWASYQYFGPDLRSPSVSRAEDTSGNPVDEPAVMSEGEENTVGVQNDPPVTVTQSTVEPDAEATDRVLATEQAMGEITSDPGAIFRRAIGLSVDHPEAAVAAYTIAGANGHDRAAYYLGQMYETGEGVPRDVRLAKIWYAKASGGIPAAAARAEALPSDVQAENISSPVHLFAGVVGDNGAIDFVWTSGAGGDPSGYNLIVSDRDGIEIWREPALAVNYARVVVPENSRFWSVEALDSAGSVISESGVVLLPEHPYYLQNAASAD